KGPMARGVGATSSSRVGASGARGAASDWAGLGGGAAATSPGGARWQAKRRGSKTTELSRIPVQRLGPQECDKRRALTLLQAELAACRACPNMVGPVVHGPPVVSRVLLIGQAPGPREGSFGRPFAWTAGKTMFKWFEESLGVDEATFRARVYMAAVARCFPGKAKG